MEEVNSNSRDNKEIMEENGSTVSDKGTTTLSTNNLYKSPRWADQNWDAEEIEVD